MNRPFEHIEDPLQSLLANAFAQQQARKFLPRAPAKAGPPESERLGPARQSEGCAAGEIASADSFLEQLQEFLDQAEPENGVLAAEPPATASPNDGGWFAKTTWMEAAPAPAQAAGKPAREAETEGAAIAKPESAGTPPLAGLYPAGGAVNAGAFSDPPLRLDGEEAAAQVPPLRQARAPRKARAAGWRYAVLAMLAGSVLGLVVARHEGKAGQLRTAAAARSETKPSQSSALLTAPAAQPASRPALISDITSSAATGSARVSIDLQHPVKYRAYRLHHPERLYFDLQDAELAPPLLGRSIALDGGLIRKIRSAQRGPDVSRVTLETDGRCKYEASIVPDPDRLIIELQPRPSARK